MAILENSRHELFCQNMANGMSTPDAYVAAGFSESAKTAHAYRLVAKDSIKQRIAELMQRNVQIQDKAIEITAKTLLAEAEEARLLAMRENQPAAAIAAITAKGKLAGVWLEKSEQTVKGGDLSQYSDAELAAIIGQPKEPKDTSNKLN